MLLLLPAAPGAAVRPHPDVTAAPAAGSVHHSRRCQPGRMCSATPFWKRGVCGQRIQHAASVKLLLPGVGCLLLVLIIGRVVGIVVHRTNLKGQDVLGWWDGRRGGVRRRGGHERTVWQAASASITGWQRHRAQHARRSRQATPLQHPRTFQPSATSTRRTAVSSAPLVMPCGWDKWLVGNELSCNRA